MTTRRRSAADQQEGLGQSDQEVRWCPGCGDYSILAAVQLLMPDLGVRREDTVFISGIGCAARFPYYMNTYGMHAIHGRAPAIATGLAMARPDLDIWVVSGDGDALSIGGNHLIHSLRRNVNLTILIFNNQIYGLTKGQYSPTSEVGKVTKSTPFGSLDHPFNPVSLALGAEATFVARTHDMDRNHMIETMRRAHDHKGAAVVEIFQNCNVFNDGAFEAVTGKEDRSDMLIPLVHGEPIRFGAELDKCVVAEPDGRLRVADGGRGGRGPDPRARRDRAPTPASPSPSSRLSRGPFEPTPIGVFRAVERAEYVAETEPPARHRRGPEGRRRPRRPAPQRRHLGRQRLTRGRPWRPRSGVERAEDESRSGAWARRTSSSGACGRGRRRRRRSPRPSRAAAARRLGPGRPRRPRGRRRRRAGRPASWAGSAARASSSRTVSRRHRRRGGSQSS